MSALLAADRLAFVDGDFDTAFGAEVVHCSGRRADAGLHGVGGRFWGLVAGHCGLSMWGSGDVVVDGNGEMERCCRSLLFVAGGAGIFGVDFWRVTQHLASCCLFGKCLLSTALDALRLDQDVSFWATWI